MQNQITTPTVEFLALYTGPNGPISSLLDATDLRGARAEALAHGRAWYDDVRNHLDLPPDASDDEVEAALDAGGWDMAYAVDTDDGWDIYSREE
jgi:hypothetical protein